MLQNEFFERNLLYKLHDFTNHYMLSEIQQGKIAHLFNVLDSNKNGELQIVDFVDVSEAIIAHLGWKSGDREAQLLIRKASRLFIQLLIDIDEPEMTISFHDWMRFFEKEIEAEEESGLLYYYVHRINLHLFTLFDLNKDNYIQLNEYANMLSVYEVSNTECKKSFDALDTNKDGQISRSELIQGLDDFFRSPKENVPGNWIFGDWKSPE